MWSKKHILCVLINLILNHWKYILKFHPCCHCKIGQKVPWVTMLKTRSRCETEWGTWCSLGERWTCDNIISSVRLFGWEVHSNQLSILQPNNFPFFCCALLPSKSYYSMLVLFTRCLTSVSALKVPAWFSVSMKNHNKFNTSQLCFLNDAMLYNYWDFLHFIIKQPKWNKQTNK